jgi:sterol desaturase/sphingolipid hydroxylase (fatty acid hydroxylase superfamily)
LRYISCMSETIALRGAPGSAIAKSASPQPPSSQQRAAHTVTLWREDAYWRWQVTLCRCVALALVVVAYAQRARLDAAVERVWAAMEQHWFVRMDSFEPVMVGVFFAATFAFYRLLDQHGSPRRLQRYKLHATRFADLAGWTANDGEFLFTTMLWYIGPLLFFDMLFPRRVLPLLAPSAARLCGEVVAMLLVYDVLFSLTHFAMHAQPWLYRQVHAKHHRTRTVHAVETFSLSFVELWVDTGCSIAAVNLVGSHPLSRLIYNALLIALLVELHSGYNFPYMLANLVPGGLLGGSLQHHLHHLHGTVHYQKFFTFLDHLLGTNAPHTTHVLATHAPAEFSSTC